jgi:hypothetical protein
MPIRGKFEPFSDDAIKAREKIVESMIVMAKCAYGPWPALFASSCRSMRRPEEL